MGVEVVYHRGGVKGLWIPETRTITLREGMGHRKLRSTFAHELGHAAHDDWPMQDRRLHARQEKAADEFAACVLITPESYEQAERLVGCHEGSMAIELGVTTHIINAWRNLYARQFA
ncbi:hypothetical protein COCCU_06120 [Corynebacterium occultum]|uniref:IrrE N-terminal-like domain-containing protein n=1 Tax=Corynebacterium occultum TaxID=2675219 RepID=A0A6B8WL77_9CORY|nr:ImmA/IrrE family metallo-endopeptidase [Corynebacterium occultum]QGU07168.1 hypothetical protein COCCU_06120 [Corynebacterium occultum]